MARCMFVATLAALVALTQQTVRVDAQTQHLAVRPMRVEAPIQANRSSVAKLNITNRSPIEPIQVHIRIVDLTQGPDGALQIIEDSERDQLSEAQHAASSRQWIEISEDQLELQPLETRQVPVRIHTPRQARGVYAAGIIFESERSEANFEEKRDTPQAGFAINLAFLVPIITDIANRPVQQKISITGVDLRFDEGARLDGAPAEPSTFVDVTIANDGQTYSAVSGDVSVETRIGDIWRPVTRVPIPAMRYLPAVQARLPIDIERRLPSGEYRLRGHFFIDGRQAPLVERTILFQGDPLVDHVALDTTLLLNPPTLNIEMVPGATRTDMVTITNPSQQAINVAMEATTPDALSDVAMDDLIGTRLSAAAWTEIRPEQFTLRAGGTRNVRLVTRLPAGTEMFPNYYADITLRGNYEDGQSAGETRSILHLRHVDIADAPDGRLDPPKLATTATPSVFAVQVRFSNVGNAHIDPEVVLRLLDADDQPHAVIGMTGQPGWLLPLGRRDFGGTLDISNAAPGDYRLQAVASFGPQLPIVQELPVTIEVPDSDQEGQQPRLLHVEPST